MILLAPKFLFALTALLVPVLIHLFNFRRAKRVYFSNNKFIKKVNEVSSSKRKIKHLLILCTRILFMLFLVFAFAQPFIPASEEALAPNVIIYFDNSHSMSNEADVEKSALDKGLFFINELVNVYPRDTKFKLVTNDFMPFSNIFRTGNEVLELITEVNYSNNTRSANEIKNKIESEKIGNTDVYWISDFQKSTFPTKIKLDTSLMLRAFPLSFTVNKNIFIDSVYVSDPYSSKPKFNFIVKNTSLEAQNNIPIQFFINDLQISSQILNIPGKGRNLLIVDYNKSIQNQLNGKIVIEDYPITFDNEFYFVLNPLGRVNVLEIKQNNAITPIQNVFGNRDLFDFNSVQIGRLNFNQLGESDIIILNEIPTLNGTLSVFLSEFLANGGTVVVVPSKGIDLNSYSAIPGIRNYRNIESEVKIALSAPDYSNPFYNNVFEEKNDAIKMPEAAPVIGGFNYRDALLNLKNGEAFLNRFETVGSTYIFTAPFDENFTDFHFHALFVPVMYKMGILSKQLETNIYQFLNNPVFKVKPESMEKSSLLKLKKDKFEVIPEQRLIGNEILFSLPNENLQTGFYKIEIEENIIGSIALNYDKRESQIDQYSAEEISSIFEGEVDVFSNLEIEGIKTYFKERFEGISLWKHCLVLSLIFLFVEVLLLRFLK